MNRFLQDLHYAADICLLSHKICDIRVQDIIRFLEEETASAGLKINCAKTKMLSRTGGANLTIVVAAYQIEAVDRFTLLDSVVATGGDIAMDIENRSNKARAASVWYGGTTI